MKERWWKRMDFGLDSVRKNMTPDEARLEARYRLVGHVTNEVVPGIVRRVMSLVSETTKESRKSLK